MSNEWASLASAATGDIIGLGFGIYDRIKQKENTKYQKELNAQIRDDQLHAFSNTVKDMQSVGMSPLAMQGLNPTGGLNAPTASVSTPDGSQTASAIDNVLSRKQQKQIADDTLEYNKKKLEAETEKAKADQMAEANRLAEEKRYHDLQIGVSQSNVNAKNRLMNMLIDRLTSIAEGGTTDFKNEDTGNLMIDIIKDRIKGDHESADEKLEELIDRNPIGHTAHTVKKVFKGAIEEVKGVKQKHEEKKQAKENYEHSYYGQKEKYEKQKKKKEYENKYYGSRKNALGL